jgi:hypothetical protein
MVDRCLKRSLFLPHVHCGPMTWGWWDSRSLLRRAPAIDITRI